MCLNCGSNVKCNLCTGVDYLEACSKDFQKVGYMHEHARLEGSGGMLPHEKKIRCSGIAFQDRNRAVVASYVVCRVSHPVFCLYLLVTKPADIKFLQEQVVRRMAGWLTNGPGCSVAISM